MARSPQDLDDAIGIKATRPGQAYGPCANIRVQDCVMETQDSGLKIGTETTSDIRDIVFERCEIKTSSRGYSANATVTIKDQAGVAVPNATVTGTWSGLAAGTYAGKTGKNGAITFASPTTKNRGTFTFTVIVVPANPLKL